MASQMKDKEAYQRLNYLYQVGNIEFVKTLHDAVVTYVSHMANVLATMLTRLSAFFLQAAHSVLSQTPENVQLARFYCFTQKTIARRLVLRQ